MIDETPTAPDLQPLSLAEIDALEEQVDQAFAGVPLPTQNRYSSRWAILRALEDQLRLILLHLAQASAEPNGYRQAMSEFVLRADAYKYALKASLDQIDSRLPDARPERVPGDDDDDDLYARAFDFGYKAAGAYSAATRVFSTVRAGTRSLLKTQAGQLRLSELVQERSYAALEALLGADDEGFSPLPLLARVFRGRHYYDAELDSTVDWGEALKALVEKTDVHRGRVKYQFILAHARDLLGMFKLDEPDLPTAWRFPWASLELAADVFAALQTRCFYHLVAIHFGAERRKLKGGGLDQICLETDPDALAKDLARLIERPHADVALVLTALTYGAGVERPDPALQPLIPIGKGRVLVPPFLVLTSAWARNMLSLHARVDSSDFDAQSETFEHRMVAQLARQMRPDWNTWTNRHHATSSKSEEVDFLIADAASRTLLLCELRWMIQPGDIREVLNRQKACREKVTQALRKRDAVRANLAAVLKDLKLDEAASWRVEALVIIDNYGGLASPAPKEVPIVPRKIFERALKLAPGLDLLHAAFTSPDWLPREGRDFHKPYLIEDIGGVEIELPFFRMGQQAYMRANLETYLADCYSRSANDLRQQVW